MVLALLTKTTEIEDMGVAITAIMIEMTEAEAVLIVTTEHLDTIETDHVQERDIVHDPHEEGLFPGLFHHEEIQGIDRSVDRLFDVLHLHRGPRLENLIQILIVQIRLKTRISTCMTKQ